jgi:hypothetical protein
LLDEFELGRVCIETILEFRAWDWRNEGKENLISNLYYYDCSDGDPGRQCDFFLYPRGSSIHTKDTENIELYATSQLVMI